MSVLSLSCVSYDSSAALGARVTGIKGVLLAHKTGCWGPAEECVKSRAGKRGREVSKGGPVLPALPLCTLPLGSNGALEMGLAFSTCPTPPPVSIPEVNTIRSLQNKAMTF